MIKRNLEIEFKTQITKEMYDYLVKKFNLEGNVFAQTNHYFDTPNLDLINQKLVLRIREKGDNYKLTSKSHSEKGAWETHIFLTYDEAKKMLDEGFNASIIQLDYDVKKVAELTTYRVTTAYRNGKIFFDKSVYYGNTDYEIEYEADSIEQGKKDFAQFLKENNIPYIPSISKSKRAYKYKDQK